jgi:hypothetical protein
MNAIPSDHHHKIGGFIFPNMDQYKFTDWVETLSRVSNSMVWKDKRPVRYLHGMRAASDTTIAEALQLDVLLAPDAHGQEVSHNASKQDASTKSVVIRRNKMDTTYQVQKRFPSVVHCAGRRGAQHGH